MRMPLPPQNFFMNRVMSFVVIGVMAIAAIVVFILFWYLFFWALLVGVILYVITRVRTAWQRKQTPPPSTSSGGQIYEHDDN